MSEILQKPPVLDFETLLRPLEGENPSGESLRYSGLYDEISEARRADDVLNKGEWQAETKIADYRKVIDIAVPALSERSKDLQVAAWLGEALVKQHGFAGLRDGLKLLTGFQREFWDTLHPEIEDGDMEGRANAITWFDMQGSLAVLGAPILDSPGNYGFIGFEDSKRFEFPENMEMLETAEQVRLNALKAQAESENRTTADMWRRAKTQTKRAFAEEINLVLEECSVALRELDLINEEKYDRNQTPGLTNLKKALDSINDVAKKVLEEKRIEEPDPIDMEVVEEGVLGSTGGGPKVATGIIQNRADALKRLGDIATFFRTTEPHSPISHLIDRAVKWGNMPLEKWLQDVIKDETVIYQLRQTLGFNTNSENSEGQ
ncbi:MAG TPA: type VI secretion system protein TssA [Pyrinomonadaceae bacterium]|nr:type VI secretion system protein TssA [Pyrinomonadaceae bacterium]